MRRILPTSCLPLLTRTVFVYVLVCTVFLCFQAGNAWADTTNLGVVYPKVREPYRSVFESIIHGIEQQVGASVRRLPLNDSASPQQIETWVEKNKLDAIIALGRRSHTLTRSIARDIPVTTGAVLMSPQLDIRNGGGIVLNPDPKVVLTKLRLFAPAVKTVVVIYNPEKNNWLIRHAKKAAQELKISLEAHAVNGLRESAKLYRDVLKRQSGTKNAVWLLNDKSVFDAKAIFPQILQEAWNRNFLVFSNNPAHVKRGVLFAMYPNNVEMGRSLAELALSKSTAGHQSPVAIRPLDDLLIAFNLRTAEHLGLDVSHKQKSEFDLVFPPR